MSGLQDGPGGGLGREAAQDAVREELSRQDYQDAEPPLLLRVVGEVLERFDALVSGTADRVGTGPAVVLLVLVLSVVAAVVLRRVGPLGRLRAQAPLFAGAPERTAEGHRRAAEEAAAAGDFAGAVRERLRAVVRDLEERGALDRRPGRTAREVARDAGAAVPALRDDLQRAADVFGEVWYGGRTADRAAYDAVVAVDERVRAARLLPA